MNSFNEQKSLKRLLDWALHKYFDEYPNRTLDKDVALSIVKDIWDDYEAMERRIREEAQRYGW